MNNRNNPLENRITKNYEFGKYTFKLEQVVNVDKLVDEITDDEFNQDERLPYWAEVWPSAMAFSEYIINNPAEFREKNMLELGCGTGLVGIAATIVGAKVTFSDYEKEALDFTQNNYFLNFGKQVKTLLLDWRNPDHDKQYEIIIAADILYERRFLKPVYNTLQKLLLQNGIAYIAEPDRTIAKPFFEIMQNGFKLEEKKKINTKSQNNKSVTLYKYKKC